MAGIGLKSNSRLMAVRSPYEAFPSATIVNGGRKGVGLTREAGRLGIGG